MIEVAVQHDCGVVPGRVGASGVFVHIRLDDEGACSPDVRCAESAHIDFAAAKIGWRQVAGGVRNVAAYQLESETVAPIAEP